MMFLAQTRSQQIEPKKTEAEKNMFLNNGSRDTEQKNKNQSPDDLKSNKSIAAINYKIAGNNLDDACEKTNENYGGWHRLVGTNSSGAGHAFPIGSHLSGFSSTFTIGTGHQEPYFGIFNSGDDDFLKNNCYPSVLLPVVPNGSTSSSIRMGWHAGSEGKVAERIFKRFQVTSSNQIYYYKYAYVMQGDFAAFLMSRVYDATTGAVLMQRQTPYKVQYATGNPGPIVPSIPFYWESDPALHPTFTDQIPGDYADSKIFYKEWTCDSFDLRNYIGQELVIEFTNADCQWGGHFAYTYINDFCEECTPTPPPTCNCDKFKLPAALSIVILHSHIETPPMSKII